MPARAPQLLSALLTIGTLLPAALAQAPDLVAFPERDILTPFRTPSEIYAPPDRLYALLRRMRAIAADPTKSKSYDEFGSETVDDDSWRNMRNEVQRIGLDAGYLASIMRMSQNADDRRTAFYAAFLCNRSDYVFNLISHIPGEPVRATREVALPRAVEYLRVHLGKKFGDLDEEQREALLAQMPKVGSPAAKARGITRLPSDDDHLNSLNLVPFFQLLDVEKAIDQAQAVWFLRQVFDIRPDLARLTLEPVLPRLRQLLLAEDRSLREQVIGLLQVIGPDDLPAADPDDDPAQLAAWAETAISSLFPPIRNINNALIQLFPSPERNAIVKAGIAALENSSIGDPYRGKDQDGQYFRGYRIAIVPDELAPLAIPVDSVITAVNGMPIYTAKSALDAVRRLLDTPGQAQKLLVEYFLDGKSRAVEYRIM